MKEGDHLFIIDGSGYIFRAYHALPLLKRKSDGLPIGAVLGFCNMLWKLLDSVRNKLIRNCAPTHLAIIFDFSSKTFRKKIYPQYKANRREPPQDLIPQFSLIRQASYAFNLPYVEKEGFEADDLIATYAFQAVEVGADVTVISSDKDFLQLVNDHVSIYDSVKDKLIGVEGVIEQWGVPPTKMVDLQAMIGDSVDNVPGIPGIGPKTAVTLIETFGDLETLLKQAKDITQPKLREKIINYGELARISRQLVQLCSTVPVDDSLESFILRAPSKYKLIRFFKEMDFKNLLLRISR
ncbi:MAG: DNA polymerase I [Candidatus Tokpelaia sp. JSC161]|jgi:DNA polymerase-1|nr:MAG: DNA polymerase I [Candidatus Tokpelaia sp. JSC161]